MAQPEPMTTATSASGVTTDSQPVDAGSNPKKRKHPKWEPRGQEFEDEIKKKMRVFKKAEDDYHVKAKIKESAKIALEKAKDDHKAAMELSMKLGADAFGDKEWGGFLPPELTNRLWKEVVAEDNIDCTRTFEKDLAQLDKMKGEYMELCRVMKEKYSKVVGQ